MKFIYIFIYIFFITYIEFMFVNHHKSLIENNFFENKKWNCEKTKEIFSTDISHWICEERI